MKTCTKCGRDDRPFYESSGTSYCKVCQKEYQKDNYRKNRDRYLKAAKERNRQTIVQLRAIRDEAKAVPCMDCGHRYAPWVMQFDHRPGETKVADVGSLIKVKSERQLRLEIAKCDVVCSNCHAERTHSRLTVPSP